MAIMGIAPSSHPDIYKLASRSITNIVRTASPLSAENDHAILYIAGLSGNEAYERAAIFTPSGETELPLKASPSLNHAAELLRAGNQDDENLVLVASAVFPSRKVDYRIATESDIAYFHPWNQEGILKWNPYLADEEKLKGLEENTHSRVTKFYEDVEQLAGLMNTDHTAIGLEAYFQDNIGGLTFDPKGGPFRSPVAKIHSEALDLIKSVASYGLIDSGLLSYPDVFLLNLSRENGQVEAEMRYLYPNSSELSDWFNFSEEERNKVLANLDSWLAEDERMPFRNKVYPPFAPKHLRLAAEHDTARIFAKATASPATKKVSVPVAETPLHDSSPFGGELLDGLEARNLILNAKRIFGEWANGSARSQADSAARYFMIAHLTPLGYWRNDQELSNKTLRPAAPSARERIPSLDEEFDALCCLLAKSKNKKFVALTVVFIAEENMEDNSRITVRVMENQASPVYEVMVDALATGRKPTARDLENIRGSVIETDYKNLTTDIRNEVFASLRSGLVSKRREFHQTALGVLASYEADEAIFVFNLDYALEVTESMVLLNPYGAQPGITDMKSPRLAEPLERMQREFREASGALESVLPLNVIDRIGYTNYGGLIFVRTSRLASRFLLFSSVYSSDEVWTEHTRTPQLKLQRAKGLTWDY